MEGDFGDIEMDEGDDDRMHVEGEGEGDEENVYNATEIIANLQSAETRVVRMAEISSEICNTMSRLDPDTAEEPMKELLQEFYLLNEEVRVGLLNQLVHVMLNDPYVNKVSSYGARVDLKIRATSHLKAELEVLTLEEQLAAVDARLAQLDAERNTDL